MRREPTSKPADLRPGLTVAPAALVASEALASLSPEELADLGQITHPYRKTNEECGFTRITWEEAYRLAAHHLKPLDGDQLGFVAGPLASSDEGLYSFAKWAHALGCSNIDGWDQSNWRQSATPFCRPSERPPLPLSQTTFSSPRVYCYGVLNPENSPDRS